MRRDSIRLSFRHKWTLYLVLGGVFLTGLVWTWLHYVKPGAGDFGSNPAEAWMLKFHGGFAMLTLLMLGTLLPLHVKFAWNAQRNRPNGITLLTVFGVLILTGYGLYYIGGESLRSWTSLIHTVVGLAFPAFLIVHIWRGRATRRKGRQPMTHGHHAKPPTGLVTSKEARA